MRPAFALLVFALTLTPLHGREPPSHLPLEQSVATNGRTFTVDGAALEIRGVCYQPAPIGSDPSQAPPFGDYFTVDYAALYERDLANLRTMGANVIRVYGWSTTADHTDFLDQCWNDGVEPIRVLVNRWINPATDWSSGPAVAAIAAEFTAIDSRLGDHPAILGLILGNEANIQNGNGTNAAFWTAMNTVAGEIKAQTPDRLVSIAITDSISQVSARDAALTNIDFWSVQVYRGTTFGVFFNEYAAASEKPLIITEFGIDAYDAQSGAPYPDDGAFVADVFGSLLAEIEANSSIVSGGCVFAYSDEWWKGGSASSHDTGGFAMGGFPDGFANEEWWGIYAVSQTQGGGPNTLAPRALFDTLQSLWKATAVSPPTFSIQPAGATVDAGGSVTLSVDAEGDGTLTYQWQKDGSNIAGATDSAFTIPAVQTHMSGAYAVVVSNDGGSVTSNAATVAVDPPVPSDARLLNLSTRALSLTGDQFLIPGFVIEGSGTKRLLIRAVGPELGNLGVTGVLMDPQMVLNKFVGEAFEEISANDNWESNPNAAEIATTSEVVGAFPLSAGGTDAALLVDLEPGRYTVVASGVADGTGVSIVELYDVSGGSDSSRLINISNRGFVGTGSDIMIPGFVVSAEGSKTLLLRAVGPALREFSVTGALPDPMLTIFQRLPGETSERLILTNDNWGENGDASTVTIAANQVGAFPLGGGSTDAAFVVTLPPGAYTVQASGGNDVTGVALVEIYLLL